MSSSTTGPLEQIANLGQQLEFRSRRRKAGLNGREVGLSADEADDGLDEVPEASHEDLLPPAECLEDASLQHARQRVFASPGPNASRRRPITRARRRCRSWGADKKSLFGISKYHIVLGNINGLRLYIFGNW